MILSKCGTKELMINRVTGERFTRDLLKQELFEVIDARIPDHHVDEKLNALSEAGFSLEEIFNYALAMH